MTTISYTELRQNLAHYLDEAVNSRAPLTIYRPKGKGNVVMIAEEEFGSILETMHQLSNPVNAEMLRESIRSLEAGEGEEHELIYFDEPGDA